MIKDCIKAISGRQWAVILFAVALVLAGEWYGQSQLKYAAMNTDQYNHQIIVAKLLNPALYASDPVFSDPANMAFYAGMPFIMIMKPLLSGMDFYQAFSAFQPWLALLYLYGMFILLLTLTERPGVSIFVALLSGFTVEVFPLDYWSVYGVGDVLPRGLFLAAVPLVFLRWWQEYQRVLAQEKNALWEAYLLLGVFGNLHPVSWFGLTGALLLTQLAAEKFSYVSIKRVLLCALCAALPMALFIANFVMSAWVHSSAEALSAADKSLLVEALYYAFSPVNPAILNYWPVGMSVALGWVLVAFWVACGMRKQVPALLRWFVLACVTLFLLFYAVNAQLVSAGGLPVLVDAYRVLRFVLLPVVITAALWLSLFKGRALVWRMIVVFFLVVVLSGPVLIEDASKNPLNVVKLVQDQVLGFAVRHGFWTEPRQPEIDEWQAMVDMGAWFKRNTPVKTLAHVSYPNNRASLVLRALGERGVTFCFKDGGFLYYSNKPLMLQWYRVAQSMDQIARQYGYCAEVEWDYARRMGADYLVCPRAQNTGTGSEQARAKTTAVYENPYFSVFGLQSAKNQP